LEIVSGITPKKNRSRSNYSKFAGFLGSLRQSLDAFEFVSEFFEVWLFEFELFEFELFEFELFEFDLFEFEL
jgi:hypothetical protein